jgi:F-type H+-transporting ATPase subunit a
MSIFFFILGLNLIGQLPFFPGSGNVTGNLSVTLVLAVIAALITNFSGNKNYWQHVFNMPGVPLAIKFILTPVELLGLFIKPMTLMLRLFANITAGHIVIIIFVSLIFIFGQAGENLGGSILGGVMAVPLTLFMMAIEHLVAFVQAFVFCILTASYIGAAIEEHHEHH